MKLFKIIGLILVLSPLGQAFGAAAAAAGDLDSQASNADCAKFFAHTDQQRWREFSGEKIHQVAAYGSVE